MAVLVLFAHPAAALATTQTAQSGSVSATFSFEGDSTSGYSGQNLEIARAGHIVYSAAVSSPHCPTGCWPGDPKGNSLQVVDLDADGEPEVVLNVYSGGAHCCSLAQVFSFDSATGSYVKTEQNFFDPGFRLDDVSHNGHREFISSDHAFAYVFSDFAESGVPIQIWSFAKHTFTDVTRRYSELIKQDAARWWHLFRSNLNNGVGYIAAWAADEDLLGRQPYVHHTLEDEARKGELRTFAPGVLASGQKFVDKLEAFLRRHGYVNEAVCSRTPIKTKDKKLDIEGCFTKNDRGAYVSDGDVEVDGLKFAPERGGTVTIEPNVPSLHTSGTGAVKLGDEITIWQWTPGAALTIPLSGSVGLKLKRDTKLFGFPLSGSLTGSFGDGALTVTGDVSLRVLGEDVTATAAIVVDHKGIKTATISAKGAGEDPRYHELSSCSLNKPPPLGFDCASVTNAKGNTYSGLVPKEASIVHVGPLPVQDLSLSYDREKHQWNGEGVLSIGDLLPGGGGGVGKLLPSLGLGVSIGTQPFQFNGGSVSDSDLNLHLGPAVLKEIKFEVKIHPQFKLSGEADLAVSTGSIEIKGGFDYDAGKSSGFQLKLHGTVSLESVTIDGFLTYDGRDGGRKITLGGSFTRSFGPASATLSLKGGVGDGHFELDGDGQVSAFGQSADGHGVLSDAGVGACAHVSVLVFSGDIGFTHYWDGGTDFNGCDFGGLKTVGVGEAHAAGVAQSTAVPAGLPRVEFAAVGSSSPPAVTLTGPDGRALSTPAVPDRISIGSQGLALAVTSSKTSYFIVDHPTAGNWTLQPRAVTPQSIRYELAKPLGALGLRAQIRVRGHRRSINWRFAAQQGVTVRFIQRGGGEQTITSTSRGTGSHTFSVAPGAGGRRDVLAVVSVDGLPRQIVPVTTFHVSPPSLPRVSRADYRVRARILAVAWSRVSRASFYEIDIRLRHGRLSYRAPGASRALRVGIGRRMSVTSVTVFAVVGGVAGRAVHARRTG